MVLLTKRVLSTTLFLFLYSFPFPHPIPFLLPLPCFLLSLWCPHVSHFLTWIPCSSSSSHPFTASMASSYNWDTRGHLKIRVRRRFQNAQAHFLTRVLGTLVRRPISPSSSPRHTSLHWLMPRFVFMYPEDQPVCIPLSRCVVNVVFSSCLQLLLVAHVAEGCRASPASGEPVQ